MCQTLFWALGSLWISKKVRTFFSRGIFIFSGGGRDNEEIIQWQVVINMKKKNEVGKRGKDLGYLAYNLH